MVWFDQTEIFVDCGNHPWFHALVLIWTLHLQDTKMWVGYSIQDVAWPPSSLNQMVEFQFYAHCWPNNVDISWLQSIHFHFQVWWIKGFILIQLVSSVSVHQRFLRRYLSCVCRSLRSLMLSIAASIPPAMYHLEPALVWLLQSGVFVCVTMPQWFQNAECFLWWVFIQRLWCCFTYWERRILNSSHNTALSASEAISKLVPFRSTWKFPSVTDNW